MMKRLLRLWLLRVLALLARPFLHRPPAAIASVLYIKPDHLGDLLLATPALAALRSRFPAARLTALIGPWSAVVLRHNSDVDATLTCPFPGFARMRNVERRTERGLSQVVLRSTLYVLRLVNPYLTLLRYAALLRAGRYDLAIVGRDDHWWGAALAMLAGIPLRVGFDVPECRPFLSEALPWDPRAHVTAQGLELVAAAGLETRRQGDKETRRRLSPLLPFSPAPLLPFSPAARFDPAPAELAWAAGWLVEHGLADRRLVMIHPGTGGPAKLWPAERWAQVADALCEDGTSVVLTGGPGEEGLVAEVAGRMRRAPLALAGQTSVGQLAALLRRAALVLGVDSGPLHLAAAQGVPSIHLYGPGDAGRFGPWGDPARHVVVREPLWCSPCGVFSACPRGLRQPECMELIAVTRVVETARRLLAVGGQQSAVNSS
jgi:heptosyltransferase-2/heptosyltransferase-3